MCVGGESFERTALTVPGVAVLRIRSSERFCDASALRQVDRSVWSTCIDAALEYVRLARDLHSGPTASNIMLAATQGTHESQLAFRWNSEQQVPTYLHTPVWQRSRQCRGVAAQLSAGRPLHACMAAAAWVPRLRACRMDTAPTSRVA